MDTWLARAKHFVAERWERRDWSDENEGPDDLVETAPTR